MPSSANKDSHHPSPGQDDLWKQDRALLEEHGPGLVESICAVAAGLRAEGMPPAITTLAPLSYPPR
jgi:hypothetical protein